MVIKKINKTNLSPEMAHDPYKGKGEQALTKNNGKDVRYRIRKQQEREADDLLKDFVRRSDGSCIQYPEDYQGPPDPAL